MANGPNTRQRTALRLADTPQDNRTPVTSSFPGQVGGEGAGHAAAAVTDKLASHLEDTASAATILRALLSVVGHEQQHPRLAYRVSEAADALDLSERTIWRLLNNGELRGVKVGTCTLIPASEIGTWLARKIEEAA